MRHGERQSLPVLFSGWRIAACVAAAWIALTAAPFVRVALLAPPEHAFPGVFFFDDDTYQYLSFAEQASRGALAFRNKFDLRPHEPFLVNVEWWALGLAWRLFGGHALLAYNVAGALAAAWLVFVASSVLQRAGLRGRSLAWGLGLFCLGGGWAWLRMLSGEPFWRLPDALTGVNPSNVRMGGGPHGLLPLALLLVMLVAYEDWRAARCGRAAWLIPAIALGLTRPYDLGTFVIVFVCREGADVVAGQGRGSLGRVLELAWLAPVLFYDALAFAFHPNFANYSGAQSVAPRLSAAEFASAFGLPLAVVLISRLVPARARREAPEGWRSLRSSLTLALAASLCQMYLPLPFAFQFAAAAGSLLLLLAAAEAPRRILPVLTTALAPTSLLMLWLLWHWNPATLPKASLFEAVERLRRECRGGDVVMADPDQGLYVAGLTPCSVVVGHRVLTPEFARREVESAYFSSPSVAPAWRRAYLAAVGARFALTPVGGLEARHGTRMGTFGDVELWRVAP